MKFPPAAHHISLTEADKVIVTLKRVEIGEYVVFVKEGETPRVRVKAVHG